ncbi:MAG TPA: hypothetical protein VHU84_04580 [Lacipirellulaceae bacterium]|jgi:hypothetical protein|nr:hypothetical protein [Lacipirellulaceae bacterium]
MFASKRRGGVWLEALLALSLVTLAALLFPGPAISLLRSADPRRWGRGAWIALNCAVILSLVALRFRRELSGMRRRRFAKRHMAGSASEDRLPGESAADYESRVRRDAEWRERAKKRLPFT